MPISQPPPQPKLFKEDIYENLGIHQTDDLLDLQAMENKSPRFRQLPMFTANPYTKPTILPNSQGAQSGVDHLKKRLDNLQKMFQEDDPTIASQRSEENWGPEERKIQKEPMYRQRKRHIQSQDTSLNPSDAEDSDDLKDFLTNKITQIKKKMRHDNPIFNEDQNQAKQFKASTLSKVQAIRNVGYDRIEDQYKNRLNKTGVDFCFKSAIVNFDKTAHKQTTEKNAQHLQELTVHKRNTMSAPKNDENKSRQKQEYKSAKEKNYVFA